MKERSQSRMSEGSRILDASRMVGGGTEKKLVEMIMSVAGMHIFIRHMPGRKARERVNRVVECRTFATAFHEVK